MNCCIKQDDEVQNLAVKKIPRPPNAFMLFANANRKIMAQKHPTESNKDISKRLGSSWKSLELNEKNKYFDRAKVIDNEHKRKYPNYVYNPKEARIRKAMREATRDRSIGASPMLPRPGSRLPAHADWAQPQESQLMMSPMDGMQRMDTPICSYPLAAPENNQYLRPLNGYNKIEPPSMMPNYMQPSPLAQLQQQTDMWHPYQDNMRGRPLGTTFHHALIPDMQAPTYHSQEPVQETATNLIMEKPRQSPVCSTQPLPGTSSPLRLSQENVMTPPGQVTNPQNNQTEVQQQPQQHSPHFLETKVSPEEMHATMLENNHQTENNPYLPVPDPLMNCNGFEPPPKVEPVPVVKKIPTTSHKLPSTPHRIYPEDARPIFSASSDYFSDKDRVEYINNYFAELPDYSLVTVNCKDGFSFPYASFSPQGREATTAFLELSSANFEPYLIPTDIGYIPVLKNDFFAEEWELA